MKLLAGLISLAAAAGETDWIPGVATAGEVGTNCGSSGSIAGNAVNATCTIDITPGLNAVFISVAGSFPIENTNTYTGFEGISDAVNQNYLIFWEMNGEDNSTCGSHTDVSITCVGNGAADSTPNLLGNFVMDPRQTSFQVPVANPDYTDSAFAFDGTAFAPVWNSTCDESGAPSLACDLVAIKGDGEGGKLAYFGFNGAAGVSNFNF